MTGLHVTVLADPGSPSPSLLAQARARSAAAWTAIVDLYTPLVYGWCRGAGLQEADALDVGQEVFRSVHAGLSAFRRDRPGDTFRGWLRTITRNKVRDFVRRRRLEAPGRWVTVCEPAVPPAGEEEEDLSERRLLLRRALAAVEGQFAPRTWAAFWGVVAEDRPAEQVAAELGTTVNVVYLAKSRVLKRLRESFAELVDGLD